MKSSFFLRILIKLAGYNFTGYLYVPQGSQICDHFFVNGFKSATCLPGVAYFFEIYCYF